MAGPARRAALAAGVATVALAVSAAGVAVLGPEPRSVPGGAGSPPAPALSAVGAATPAPAARAHPDAHPDAHPELAGYRAPRAVPAVPLPVRLRIASLGVDSPLDQLGQAPDRTVEVPSDPLRAGWYARGPRPGQPGPAVLLGHVDGRRRPGVFFRVHELRAGDPVTVTRSDGTEARFRVTRTERMPKTAFPTADVYLPTPGPELRLVTCGGRFDTSTGHYRDNVVVYASLA